MGIGTRLVGKRFVALASTAALAGSAGVAVLGVLAGPAAAAAPLPTGCTSSPTSIVCTFTSPGEYAVPIPANTIAVTLNAVGGRGGDAPGTVGYVEVGGVGASVSASGKAITAAAVAAGELYAEVGSDGAGGSDTCTSAPLGGANGGGAGGCVVSLAAGAGGGGASDVRTVPVGTDLPVGSIASLRSRVLVAAGGGGGGHGDGSDGGAAGEPGFGYVGEGGLPGTATGPGYSPLDPFFTVGGLGVGGNAEQYGVGGGGGAGVYGGGGGEDAGGGGGGGSSLVPNGGTIRLASTAPQVTIELTLGPDCALKITGSQPALVIGLSSGLTCIQNATVRGGITIAPGAQVLIDASIIDGSITSFDAATFSLCASTAAAVAVAATTGPVVIGDPDQSCGSNTLSSLIASGNTGGVTIEDNTIRGGWTVVNNTPPATVTGNHH